MENWRDIVAAYPDNPEPKDYAKALRSADTILSGDLAPFEAEWLTQTLFFKPVSLFDIITTKRTSEDWLKYLADSFKVLSKIFDRFWVTVKNYCNDMIELCMLSFDAQTRKEAILCLLSIVKHPVMVEDLVVARHIAALEEAKTCKAPLAQLVGTICKYHPERVQGHFTRIWRIYLNMLQPSNKTDTIVNSVLHGINGLFEYFGDDIEMDQLNRFYDMMSREYFKISKCLDVLLLILKHHARLFKERLAADKALRLYLWQIETKTGMDALSNVYDVVLSEVNNVEDIINTEVQPKVLSRSVLVKHTALRIIIHSGITLSAGIPSLCSAVDLEFQLRSKKLSYEEANTVLGTMISIQQSLQPIIVPLLGTGLLSEMRGLMAVVHHAGQVRVSWCIGSSVANSETMLLTAILFYDNLPSIKKRDIIVNGILKASDEVRKSALLLLLQLSLQDHLDKYMDIWRVLLDNTTGPDLTKAVLIFEEALHHLLEVLASFTEDSDKAYEQVRPILSVMAVLLSLQRTEFRTEEWCQSIRPSLVHLAKQFHVSPARLLNETPEDDEIIYVEKFHEDTVLSKLLSTLNAEDISHQDILTALEVIFSRDGTDLKLLTKALSKLEVLMETDCNKFNRRRLSMIINQIVKLKSKSCVDDKDARIFQKDVAMFLGKYRHLVDGESFTDDIYVMKLKQLITLNVPNIIEGTTYKIDLRRALQLCLLWGDPEALYALLVLLSANLCDRSDPGLQEATVRVIHAVFKTKGVSATEIAVYPALLMCGTVACVQAIVKAITEEMCPDARRKLSNSLEVLLTHDPGSDTTAQLLSIVAEQAVTSGDDSSTASPRLEITRAFIAALKDNNTLAVQYLPNILTATSHSTEASEIFQITSDMFIEKIGLFRNHEIKKAISNIIEQHATNIENDPENILGFIKRVIEATNDTPSMIVEIIFDFIKDLSILSPQFLSLVALWGLSNAAFNFDNEIRKNVVDFQNGMILDELLQMEFNGDGDEFKINGVLVFLKEYAVELNAKDSEKTLQCLGNIIENMPLNSILSLKKNLSACLLIHKALSNYTILMSSYEKWYKKLDLPTITEHLEENILISQFSDTFSDAIHALLIMSDLIEHPTMAVNWTGILLQNLSDAEIKWGRIFLSDLLIVSEKCLPEWEFGEILENNLDFVKSYVNVYFNRLIGKPFVLSEDKCSLIVDIVEYFSKTYKEENFQNVLDLVEHLWPTFQEVSNFDEKQSVLLNLLRLPRKVDQDCQPVQWAITLLTSEGTKLEDKIKLIETLPAGEEYSVYYRNFASCLPVRLSEMRGPYIGPLRALLNSLAANGDMTLFDIVITLAGGDDSKGWWDHAIDACMKSLAAKEDANILDKAYRRTKFGLTLGVCNRIFLPLLRHSSRKFCEGYLATIVMDLFGTLRIGFKEPTNSDAYRKRVLAYAVAFNILKVAFEKISSDKLECGVLNESAGSAKPWHFMEQTCKYCVTISAHVKCPTGASDDIRDTCLWLQCSAYNCLTTAICRRKPKEKLYTHIFNAHAWTKIVDLDAVYTFYLQAYARYRGSKPTKRAVDSIATSSSFTGTVRSRLFLTTLSENPLQYDMIPEDEDQEDDEEESTPELEDSVLNVHGCLSTVTSLLEHASTLEHTHWRDTVVAALTGDLPGNVKWLLAQAICNAVDDLKPHAATLCPALIKFISDTPVTDNGKKTLNNLHIDVLSAIIKWSPTDVCHDPHINSTIEYLIATCIDTRFQRNINRRLLNTLNGVVQIYGNIVTVSWNVFSEYCNDLQKDGISLLPIFERLLKNGVALPELLANIFTNDAKFWTGSKLPEVCGLALSLADSVTRDKYLAKFRSILHSVRGFNTNSYVKIVFYAQRSCPECCDLQIFKVITDLAPKIEKSKCLSILSTYLEHSTEFNEFYVDMFQIISLKELFDGDQRVEAMRIARNSLRYMDDHMRMDIVEAAAQNCRSSSVQARKAAYSVVLKAFQDLVQRDNPHPSKRRAVDSSPILDNIDSTNSYNKLVMQKTSEGIFDADESVAKMMCDGVEASLSEEIPIRFAELFYIIVYQYSVSRNELDLCNCGSKLLELVFSGLRRQEAFQAIRLRDEGLSPSILRASDGISTKSYARTLLRSSTTFRQRVSKAPERREINVQMPITEILNVFLQLSKVNSQVCQELCVQMMKCLQGTGRRFDLHAVMAKQLAHIMKREPNCLTPLVLDACRVFVNGISSVQGFKESVELLRHAVVNSEGYLYTNILYEDLLLRDGDRNQFVFSMIKEDTDAAMRNQEFSLQELIDVFGALSNWDNLTLQDKRQVELSLPPLWIKDEDFTVSLRNYFEAANKKLDYGLWFNKMVASYYPEEVSQDRVSWLKQTEKWPWRDFVTSAIIEAIQWHQAEGPKVSADIQPSDCLAEWSARLMIRSAYIRLNTDSPSQETNNVSRDELVWCREANQRNLPQLALQCIKRNKGSLQDVEILPWLQEKVTACRSIALKENDSRSLQTALEAAEKNTVRFASISSMETNISMQGLILRLHHDLGSLTYTKLDDIMQEIAKRTLENKGMMLSSSNAQVLKSIYETAMIFYDELWDDNDELIQNDIITKMSTIIDQVLEFNLTQEHNLLFSVLLNRLAYSQTTISDATAKSLLDQIYRVFHHLDFFSVDILKKVIAVLPAHVLDGYHLDKLQDVGLDVCKEYFQLICDVNYSLLQYCDRLRRNVLDDNEWTKTFDIMKKKLFESEDGGSDYQSLNTLKNKLYALENTASYDGKATELRVIIEQMKSKPQRGTLCLSQLCPKLCSAAILEGKRSDLQRMLRLPPNVYVDKFYEQVTVFTDSIRRPCVVKARLSTGITRSYICKSGEPMYRDASVQRAAAVLPAICDKLHVRSYNVTPLSDDSAIIEYLEDHKRLRDLMEEKHDINIAVSRAGYDKLVLAPSLAVEQFNSMCDKVTPYILRSAIEGNCSCVEEFIAKKRTFEDTLSSMTIINWLFGVGDRHLQNIMYSVRDGGVCGVDWASVFQYGVQELPPARLTANLLAVCDIKVLESRLQNMLDCLRSNRKLYEAFIRTSFYWLGPDFNEINNIKRILEGNTVSYEITRSCIENSDKKYKYDYMRLLDQVFENFTPKDTYSVEDQISCLLQHCTEPRILSVTPQGWEAWL